MGAGPARRRFFSLGELNAAIRELLDELNTRTMRRIGSSRHALFEAIERTALLSLPSESFEYAEWKRCRPGLDYHIEVHGHWYSVPYRLIREVVEARVTDRSVEVFHHGVRVAVHVRNPVPHRHTTLSDHMPSAHRRYADWTPARLRREAAQIGPAAAGLIELILTAKPHPEQGFRACLGILRLVRAYGAERVEAACQRGIDIGARTYGSIVSILRNNLDRAYRPQPVPDAPSVQHGNIRGGRYYH
jgi:transposase